MADALPGLAPFLASAALPPLAGVAALPPLAALSGTADAGLFLPTWLSVEAPPAAANLAYFALKSTMSFLYFSLAWSDYCWNCCF